MKNLRVAVAGVLIWILGVLSFTASFFVPIMENMELQANLVLMVAIIPIVWLGSFVYYKKGPQTHGLTTGLIFFAISALLDVLITVPFLVMPNGGSYYQFFTDMGFWLIGMEFVSVTVLYWYIRVKRTTQEFI